jgi:hypothetical protein
VQALAAGRLRPAVVPFGGERIAQPKCGGYDKISFDTSPGSRSNTSVSGCSMSTARGKALSTSRETVRLNPLGRHVNRETRSRCCGHLALQTLCCRRDRRH